MKSILVLIFGIVLVFVVLFKIERNVRAKNDQFVLDLCISANETFRSENGEDENNCQCTIDSVNAETNFLDSFFKRKRKSVRYHYLKCSKKRYISKTLESGIEIGNLVAEEQKQKFPEVEKPFNVQIFARCYAEKMYVYDYTHLDDFDTDSRDDFAVGVVAECIKSN